MNAIILRHKHDGKRLCVLTESLTVIMTNHATSLVLEILLRANSLLSVCALPYMCHDIVHNLNLRHHQ